MDPFDDDYDDFDPLEMGMDEDEATALEECGQVRDGGCLKAGSEYCDFDCPFRDMDMFADDEEM